MEIKSRRWKFIRNGAVCLVLFTAFIVFAVLAAFETGWRLDLTEHRIFTLSRETEDVLEKAGEREETIRIAAIYPEGREEAMVVSLLNEYEKASQWVLTEYIDAEKNPAGLASYDLGDVQAVYNGTLIVECGGRTRLVRSQELFGSDMGSSLFYGEREITGAIRYVTADELPVVYFLAGHGELAVQGNLTQAVAELRRNAYDVRQLVILQEGIPEDASILVMASPEQDLNQEEQARIHSFLADGGKLLLLLEPVMTSNEAGLPFTEDIVREYGIDISNNYVVEEDSRYHLAGESLYLIPRFGAHDITAHIGEAQKMAVLPTVRGLGQVETDETKVITSILLLSSDKAWARNDMTIGNANRTGADIPGPLALGFASQKQEGNGVASKVVVIGDSDFAADGNYSVQANGNLFMSSVDWLQGDRESGSLAGKVINSYSMPVRGDVFIKLACICCLVLPLIAFGTAVYIWRVRRNR